MTSLANEVIFPQSRWQQIRSRRLGRRSFAQSLSATFVFLFILTVILYIGLFGWLGTTTLGTSLAFVSGTLLFGVVISSASGYLKPQQIFGESMRHIFETVFTFFLRALLLLAYPVLVINAIRVRVKNPELHPSLYRWVRPRESKAHHESTWLEWETSREVHIANPFQRALNIFFLLRRKYGFWVALLLTFILIIATLLVLIQSSAVAPFIYTLF